MGWSWRAILIELVAADVSEVLHSLFRGVAAFLVHFKNFDSEITSIANSAINLGLYLGCYYLVRALVIVPFSRELGAYIQRS